MDDGTLRERAQYLYNPRETVSHLTPITVAETRHNGVGMGFGLCQSSFFEMGDNRMRVRIAF